jgi:hypothetical protein
MSRTSSSSRPGSAPARSRGAAWALPLVLLGCGTRDGQVGAGAGGSPGGARDGGISDGGVSDGGVSDGGGQGSGALIFSAEMGTNEGVWDVIASLPGAGVVFGAPVGGSATRDGFAAALTFPGDPSGADARLVGSDANTGIESTQLFHYGTLRARVRWTTCDPSEEVASAATLYESDGRDTNGNGLPDLHELDFQVLCGTPSFVVLTAWSDYQKDALGRETFLKRSHAIDTATGDVYDTLVPGDGAFTQTDHATAFIHSSFPDPTLFYDIGISWQVDRVRFSMTVDGSDVTLWELTDVAYLPRVPLTMIFNLWHPPNHWLPSPSPAAVPSHASSFFVDRAEWYAE